MQGIVRESRSVLLWDAGWDDYKKNNFGIIYSVIVVAMLIISWVYISKWLNVTSKPYSCQILFIL